MMPSRRRRDAAAGSERLDDDLMVARGAHAEIVGVAGEHHYR